MALDLSMKSRKRSHGDSESGSPTPVIRTVDVDADVLRTEGVLDLSVQGASKRRSLSQSSMCSDHSDTSSVTRRLERTSLQSRTPPSVPTHKNYLLNGTRQGGFVVPGPYSPTFVRTGSISAGNSPAAGTASGNHFLFPPPVRGPHSHSLSPISSSSQQPVAPSTVTSSQQHLPYSSYMSTMSSPATVLSSHPIHPAQMHAALVQARRSLTPPGLTPPSHRRMMMMSPGIPLPTWSRLQAQHLAAMKGGSTSTYTDSDDEGTHTPTKLRTRSETSLKPPPFRPMWHQSKHAHHLPSTSSVSDTPPSSPEGHMTPPTPTTGDDDDDVFITLPFDPRDWTRADVHNWLKYMEAVHNITDIKSDRFLMNGKALCLMNANMFAYRVPVGGKMLFRDFRTRLGKAMAAEAAKNKAKAHSQMKGGPTKQVKISKDIQQNLDGGKRASSAHGEPSLRKQQANVEEKENVQPAVRGTEDNVKEVESDSCDGRCDNRQNTPAESPTPIQEVIEERPDSPILDVTTVDEDDTPLGGAVTPVTCVA